jgi:hypothetical protein
MKTKIVTSRDPAFLKSAYAVPDVELISHTGYVEAGERFIEKDGKHWDVAVMTPSRAHRWIGSYPTIRSAIFAANR